MKYIYLAVLFVFLGTKHNFAQTKVTTSEYLHAFGQGGQIKMLYDRRQRPQSLLLDGKVYIVFNGGGKMVAPGKSPTFPMITTYDPSTGAFSEVVTLGPGSSDHHDGPVIWPDSKNRLHVLYGCHRTPGVHLISAKPASIGKSIIDWRQAHPIAPSLSYPTFYQIAGGQELVYYRTFGHTSSWTYRIANEKLKDWIALETDVTDLDSKGHFEWSSYHTTLPSRDGKFLHVVFTAYDDNKSNDPERYFNTRYQKPVSNEWKYNLYYLKINLETAAVTNFKGEALDSPIDLDQANESCRIWDTEGRGAGVPPDIVLDEIGNPAFLHVLSEETTEIHNYYFVRLVKGKWKKTVIAPANHQWNSTHIQRDQSGHYHAYLVMGDQYVDTDWVEGKNEGSRFKKGTVKYLNTGGFMDKHGGGRIEKWTSTDQGNSWVKTQDLTPTDVKYKGWKYNNIQPVTHPDGRVVEGMLLFYGWKDKDAPNAKAFLWHKK